MKRMTFVSASFTWRDSDGVIHRQSRRGDAACAGSCETSQTRPRPVRGVLGTCYCDVLAFSHPLFRYYKSESPEEIRVLNRHIANSTLRLQRGDSKGSTLRLSVR